MRQVRLSHAVSNESDNEEFIVLNRMAQLTASGPEEQLQQPLRRGIVELRRIEGSVEQYAERASALLPDVDNESAALFKWIHASACLQHTELVPNEYRHPVVALLLEK